MGTYVIGAAYTALGRHYDLSVPALTALAVEAALEDAGITVAELEGAVYANTRQGVMEGQHGIRGHVALRPLGIQGVPIINTDNACASSGFAFAQARALVESGAMDVVLVAGTEKMWYPDSDERVYAAFMGSMDVSAQEDNEATIRKMLASTIPPAGADDAMGSVFMGVYAAYAREYMHRYGTTVEQMASVASKAFDYGALNPRAQRKRRRTVEEVLTDRLVVWPLTRSMCAPVSDGSAALILCSDRALERFDRGRAVRVAASAMASGTDRDRADFDRAAARLAGDRAYSQAGISPDQVNVAEVHDAVAFGEIMQAENLRLFPRGEAGLAAERGETGIGGSLPINTSGGLLAKGHPTAATGAAQICDIVEQLRGEAGTRQVPGARVGLTECGGGFYGVEDAAVSVNLFVGP